ncbi:MAG TPA: type II secretion system F family protein [Candidatus Dormibacteraeota bacterium]|nr:type II secretion system F family protein [Candidatus Dormibacteraeota bacterium]
MGEFVCKVADPAGHVFQQVETAQSEDEARTKLTDRGLFIYWVRQRRALSWQGLSQRRDRAVRGNDFLIFNQQFNTLIKAGLPILQALDLLAERTAAPRLRPILSDVRQQVREGALLSEAIQAQGIFPSVYASSVLAGEKSGNLAGVLDQYIAYQRTSSGLRKRLTGVLIYPMVLVVVATGILSYLVTYVIPQFVTLYKDMNVALPGPTVLLIALVTGLKSYIALIVGVLVVGIVGGLLWSRTETGGMTIDRLKLKLPVVGDVWVKFQVTQFTRTLSTLLMGGTPLVPALDTAASSLTSKLMADAVNQAAQRVREGQPLAASLAATNLMPSLAVDMIEVGEASGALPAMLASVSEFFDEEVNVKLTTLISFIEPAILVFMGAVIAFILIALYLPLFSFSVGNMGG